MGRARSKRSSAALIGQQTVASRREVREQRTVRTFRQVGITILTLIIMGIMANIWLVWAAKDSRRSLTISQDEYQQGNLFNRELVAQRDKLLSRKSIERKAAVLGLFKPGKKQIRRP
jgi:hypothetical protein